MVNAAKNSRSVTAETAGETPDLVAGLKIERLVLSIATNQFTVPLPSGKDVINAVNAYPVLVAALGEIANRANKASQAGAVNVAGWRELKGIEKAALTALVLADGQQ